MHPPEQCASKMFQEVVGSKVCRTCLRKSSNMKLLDDSSIKNLREICFIELSPEDKDLKICIPCYHQLFRAAQFRKGCLLTSRTLLNWTQRQNNSEQVDVEAFSNQPSSFSELTRSSLLSVECLESIKRYNGKPNLKIYTHCLSKTLFTNEDSINTRRSNSLSEPTIKKEVLSIYCALDDCEKSFKRNECRRNNLKSFDDESHKTNESRHNRFNLKDEVSHETNEPRKNSFNLNDSDSHKTNQCIQKIFNLNDDDSHKTSVCRRNSFNLNNDVSQKTNERKKNIVNLNDVDSHKTNECRQNSLKSNNDDSHKTNKHRWHNLKSNERRQNSFNLNDDNSYKIKKRGRNKSNNDDLHKRNEHRRSNFGSNEEDFFKSEKTQGGSAHKFIDISDVKLENDDVSDFSQHNESGYDAGEEKVRSKKRGLKKELLGEKGVCGEDRGKISCGDTDESDAEPLHAKVQRKCEKSEVEEHGPVKRPRTRFEPSKVLVVRQTEEQQLEELERMRLADKYLAAPYRCHACAKYFVSETSLHQHNQRHEESFGAHACPVCSLRYSGAVSLSRHRQTHTERYRCTRCPAVFCAAKSARGHAAAHDGERPTYVCTHCGKISKSLGTHKRHEKLHTKERPYKCDRCPRDFTQSSARNYHIMRVHTKVHNYSCPSCPSTFVTPTALQAHSRRHSSERAHYCVECDLHFKSPSSLRSHLTLAVRHALPSALRFACEQCDLRYTTRQRLLDHVHSNHERSFRHACTDCDKAYHTLGSLKKHRASRHVPGARQRVHRCGQCDKAFTTPTVLKIHLRTHSGEMPYSCPVCSRTFRHTSSLWNHNKLVHKKGATDLSKD